MEIKISKPLLVLDIEATGDQINKDRIVEIGMIKTNPDGTEETYEKRINPHSPTPTSRLMFIILTLLSSLTL